MPKPKSDVLTEAEQRIMRVLWEKGEASVRDVTDALEPTYPVAYNTVLTLLRILTDKDYVVAAPGWPGLHLQADRIPRRGSLARPAQGGVDLLRRIADRTCATPHQKRDPQHGRAPGAEGRTRQHLPGGRQ